MKILTENAIIVQKGNNLDTEDYYNANGKIKDKLKGLVGSGKVQGVLAALGNTGSTGNVGNVVSPSPAPKPAKKGMSTGVKVGIGAGILLLGVGIWYFGFHKKGK